jgi:hypothetical protein
MLLDPLDDPPIHARAKRLHQIIRQRRAPLAGDVRDAKRRVQPDAEKFLQHRREQHGVTIIEQIVQTAPRPVARKLFITQAAPENLPENFGADGFLVRLLAQRRVAQAG